MTSAPGSPAGLLARLWRRMRPWLAIGVPVVTLAGCLSRYFLADRVQFASALFYMLPLPLLICGTLLTAWLHRSRWLVLMVALIGASSLSSAWRHASWGRPENAAESLPAKTGDPVRVLFWNINHPSKAPRALDRQIIRLRPDIVGIAESERLTAPELKRLRQAHPDYTVTRLPEGLLLLTRGTVVVQQSVRLEYRSHVFVVEVQIRGQTEPWRVVFADLGPWPLRPRTPRLDAVRSIAGIGPRTLIMGDFNTPLDATGFQRWRTLYRHGLADCPHYRGPVETWPFGLPLLAIDHLWCSREMLPFEAEKGWSVPRDHAWIFAEFAPVYTRP